MTPQRVLILALVGLILTLALVAQVAQAKGACSYIKYPRIGSRGKSVADKDCYACCVNIHKFIRHKRSKYDMRSCSCSM